ncbi:MAG: (2Fe-2S)-binding protein [Mesorhizobium sp.]
MTIRLSINGEERSAQVHPLTPLVDVIRDELLLTGTKSVCREGFCGACTVHVDGVPTMSCLLPAIAAEGKAVVTIEGVGGPGNMNSVQKAFEEHDVVQCGMCFPGMVMSMTAYLETHPAAPRADIKAAMSGNICRCTGYERIVDALLSITTKEDATA